MLKYMLAWCGVGFIIMIIFADKLSQIPDPLNGLIGLGVGVLAWIFATITDIIIGD